MRHIVICGLSGSKIFFPHYLMNGTIFGGGNANCVLIFSTHLSKAFLVLRRIQRDMVNSVYWY